MSGDRLMPLAHPLGEQSERETAGSSVVLDTFAGRVHVEWEPAAPVTALGHLPFFVEFLKQGGLFDSWVAACPLHYTSPNASKKRDVLGTMVLSILAGHRSHHGGARGWRQPGPAGDGASEDAVRRALKKMPERRSGCAAISMRRRCWGFRGFWTWMPRSNRCSATRKERAIIRTSRGGRRTRCTPTGWPACAWSWMSRPAMSMRRRIRRRRCGGSAGPLTVAAARGCRFWDGADHEPGRAGRDAVPVQVAQHAQRQAVDRESYGRGRLAGQGWQGKASTLRLQGWSRHRRILRRRLAREVLVTDRPRSPTGVVLRRGHRRPGGL